MGTGAAGRKEVPQTAKAYVDGIRRFLTWAGEHDRSPDLDHPDRGRVRRGPPRRRGRLQPHVLVENHASDSYATEQVVGSVGEMNGIADRNVIHPNQQYRVFPPPAAAPNGSRR